MIISIFRKLRIWCPVTMMVFLCTIGCTKKKEPEVSALKEKVTFCQGGNITLLTQNAVDRGFFGEEGVEAQINKLGSGVIAMDTFLAGDCNFGIMAEPPIVKQAFVRDDFVIIASLAHSDDFTRILARKDRGITIGKHLKGKTLGVNKGTTSQTFADLYMKKHGLTTKDVTIKFMDLKDMPSALAAGDIDAYSSTGTYFLEGKRSIGDNAALLNEPGLYPCNSYLIAKKEYIKTNGETVRRVLKALKRAEQDIATRHDEARKLLASSWKVSESDAEFLLKQENNVLALGQQQLDALNMQTSWMLEKGGVAKQPAPNFTSFMDMAPLVSVKPGISMPTGKK